MDSGLPLSSSSTLWATASKEWVIQPKPKLGRKPKKDAVPPISDVEEVGRRVQNRAAQRAFRERKQSRLAELQARVQLYEQGEMECNITLQTIAKRLKEENEQLRKENSMLKEKISSLEGERNGCDDNKRWRDDSPTSAASSIHAPAKKKSRPIKSPPSRLRTLSISYTPSPPLAGSTPDSNGSSITRLSPIQFDSQSEQSQASLATYLNFATDIKSDNQNVFTPFDCGFCNDVSSCVCREIALQNVTERSRLPDYKPENFHAGRSSINPPTPNIFRLSESSDIGHASVPENSPGHEPLPRRTSDFSANRFTAQVMQGTAPPMSSGPSCSGDPSDCMACANDDFGREFCAAIEDYVSTQGVCADCPTRRQIDPRGGCANGRKFDESVSAPLSSSSSPTRLDYMGNRTIPTNEAWRQIKAHPNVAFADLRLLADVVASHAKCGGPCIVVTPNLSTSSQDVDITHNFIPSQPDDQPFVLPLDLHAPYAEERPQLRGNAHASLLVPQNITKQCGKKRIREVPADAVRDALRTLDTKFAP